MVGVKCPYVRWWRCTRVSAVVEEGVAVRVVCQACVGYANWCDEVASSWVYHSVCGCESWLSEIEVGESSCVSAVSSSVGLDTVAVTVGCGRVMSV